LLLVASGGVYVIERRKDFTHLLRGAGTTIEVKTTALNLLKANFVSACCFRHRQTAKACVFSVCKFK